ncbi:MAG: RHS repeat protein, partial [bacterium]|nr:RHS repeat protein [bacterium]
TYEYDEYGRQVRMILPLGNVWDYVYDLNDNLTDVFGPLDYHAEFEYDADNLLVWEKDADGAKIEYVYDERARLIEIWNGEDEPIYMTYGEMNELETVTNARGAVTTYEHDNNYHVIKTTMAEGSPEEITLEFVYDGLGNVIFVTDGEGRVTATTYDGLNRPYAVVQNYIEDAPRDAETNVLTLFEFDYRGNAIKITNPLEDEVEMSYDSVGRLAWSENEEDERTTFEYDPNSNLTRVTYPEGNFTETDYNGRNQPEFTRDGEGLEWEYLYDANGNLTNIIAPDDVVTHYNYNKLDQQVTRWDNYVSGGETTDEQNVVTHYEYSLADDLLKVTDAEGYEFTFVYDLAHRLRFETNPEGMIEYRYDDVGNLTELLDANGHLWTYDYDLLDRLEKSTNPEGHFVTYEYDRASNLIEVTDARGHATTTEYDALSRPVKVTAPAPLGYETLFVYDEIGNLLTRTDGNDHTTTYEYDKAQRLTVRTDAEAFQVLYEYDDNGRLDKQTIPFADPAQTIVNDFAYDGRDLLTITTNGEGETLTNDYNSVGLLETMMANDSLVTLYEYDGLRRVNRVTLNYQDSAPAVGDVNVAYHYLYDGVGNLVEVTDPLGNTTLFGYNGLGTLEYEQNPLEDEWFYDHDPNQNVISRLDANGEETLYSYYDDNRLAAIDYPDDADVTYTYDENNNPLTMQDGLGTTSWDYDVLNRPTSITDSLGRTVDYTYDAVNRRSVTYPDRRTVAYTYLDNDWMDTVTDPVGGVSQYTHDEAGRATRVEHPNNTYSTSSYDRANRLLEIANYQITRHGDDILSSFAYIYDAIGQRTQATKTYGWRNPSVVVENYTYDGLRRLTGVTDSEGMVAAYGYDRASNRTLWETNDDPFGQSPQDGFTATYTYNAANQLLTADIQRKPPAQSETVTYIYDGNGNRVDRLIEGNGADAGMAYT